MGLTENSIASTGRFQIGDYFVDVGDNTIATAESNIHIEPKAMQVLYVLACNAGETVSRDQLMQDVWDGRIVVEDALTRTISKLRIAFADNIDKQVIQTVPKKGYRLKAKVIWKADSGSNEFSANAEQHTKEIQTPSQTRTFSDWFTAKATEKRLFIIAAAILSAALILSLLYIFNPVQSDSSQEPSAQITSAQHSQVQHSPVNIALLPLQNLAGDEQTRYLAEGIPEEISGLLANNQHINVKSRFATYAKQGLQLNEIADLLSVQYLLEGSVRKSGEQHRILMRLVDAESEQVIWSSVYEDSTSRLFEIQFDVVNAISRQLVSSDNMKSGVELRPAKADVVAYQHYLKGLYWLMQGKTSEWFHLAESAFLAAIEQDQSFAAAHGRLAYIYARYDFHDVFMPDGVALQRAHKAIRTALALDPDEINAHLAQAVIATKARQFNLAEQALTRALAIQANHTTALYLYSELELARNNFEQSLHYAEQAQQHDPLSPWVNVNLAIVHYWLGNFDQALSALDTAISVDQGYTWAYVWQSKVHQAQGELGAAIKSMETCLELDSASPLNSAWLATLYLQSGQTLKAEQGFEYTASLYGDADDARFWQSYLRFQENPTDFEVLPALMAKLALLDNTLFSLVPMLSNAVQTDEQKNLVLGVLLAEVQLEEAPGYFVNVHNLKSAQALLSFDIEAQIKSQLQAQIDSLLAQLPISLLKE